jgi:hypothetical protein
MQLCQQCYHNVLFCALGSSTHTGRAVTRASCALPYKKKCFPCILPVLLCKYMLYIRACLYSTVGSHPTLPLSAHPPLYPLVTWNVWDVGVLVAPPRTQCRPLMRGGVSVRDALQVRGEFFAVVVALLLLHVRFVERNVVFHERRFVQRLVVHLPSNGASLCTHQPISSARIVLSSAAPARMASRQGSQCVCVCVYVCVCVRAHGGRAKVREQHRKGLGLDDVSHAGLVHDASLRIRVREAEEGHRVVAMVRVRQVMGQHTV